MNKRSFKTSALWAVFCSILSLSLLTGCGASRGSQNVNPVYIGIAWQADTDSEYYTNAFRAIKEAGGTPVLLPQVKPWSFKYDNEALSSDMVDGQGVLLQKYASELKSMSWDASNVSKALSSVSAVVFTGGEDISPTLYKNPEPWHGIEAELDYNASRDVSDYLTMKYCVEMKMPVLGLCRGMQMLCVVSGGTVVQDIPSYLEKKGVAYDNTHRLKAEPGQSRDYTSHDVKVLSHNSILYKLSKTDVITGAASKHHQSVSSVDGSNLAVVGVTPTQGTDVIEAVERTDRNFVLGLQYHPEVAIAKNLDKAANASDYMSYKDAMKYFKELVKYARGYRNMDTMK